MENSKFKLHNFRVFDEKGASFEIAPITIITGANSSGKSSVLKSLMLLNENLKDIVENYIKHKIFNPLEINLEFHKGKHNLGTYEKAKSRYSETDNMTFSYEKYSDLALGNVKVDYSFIKDEKSFLKKGFLSAINIYINNDLIFKVEIDYETKDINASFIKPLKLLESFSDFVYTKKELIDFLADKLGYNLGDVGQLRYYKSTTELYSTFNDNNLNDKIKRYYKIANKLLKIDNTDKLVGNLGDLHFENIKQLLYFPFDKFIDTSKENIINSFTNKVADKFTFDESNSNIENYMIKNCELFFEAYVNSNFEDINEFYKTFEDEALSKLFPNYVSKTKFRYLIDAIQGGNNLIRSIQLDISTFDNTSKRSHAGTFNLTNINNWHEESFKADNLDELSAINVIKSLFSVFFNIDEKKFENRTGSGEYSFDIMDLNEYYIPLEFELYNIFLTAFLQECLISLPSYIIDNTFVDAVRANVLRMYTYKSQGTDFNDLIINYISGLKQDDNRSEYKLGTFMNKWIKEFDIADDVIFEPTEDGLGVHIFIVKDNEKILLADEGYGITQLLSIFLQIELNIIKSEYRYTHQFIMNQEVQYKASTISIEEPEVNLHPKFQSKLAEMFYDAYDKYNVRFILETHSEYLIRKLQTMVANNIMKNDDISINYIFPYNIEKEQERNNQVVKINILDDGRLDRAFGTGFFDEADNLALELLTIKSLN